MKTFKVLVFKNKGTLENAEYQAMELGLRYWVRYESKRFFILLLCTNRKLWELGRNMK